ncbi:MAG: hypothetical protein ABJA90_12140 [Ginsengibacter sp.]
MKKIITLASLAFCVLILVCCKKHSEVFSSSIAGSWELRKVTGGFRGIYPGNDYAPGNGNTWIISNATYQTYHNHSLIHSGSYSLGKDLSPATGQVTDFLILNANEKIYFEVQNDTMTLYRGELAYDGTIEKYKRIEDNR